MNRLQKKCMIASVGCHVLLIITLFVGPAFFSRDTQSVPVNLITVLSGPITDGPTGGPRSEDQPKGSPAPQITPPTPPPPPDKPITPPVPTKDPTPVTPQVKEVKLPTEKQPTTPQKGDDFKIVNKDPRDQKPATNEFQEVKNPPTRSGRSSTAKSTNVAVVAQNQTPAISSQIGKSLDALGNALGKNTGQVQLGPGFGEPATNYRDLVYSIYFNAWHPPVSLTDESAVAEVSITVAKNGTVTRHDITKPSKNGDMDRSVQTTLDNVTYISPFPAGSKDTQRTYTIRFNLSAKRTYE